MSTCAQVDKSLTMRSDVGTSVNMVVRVSNVRSTDIARATLDIFYPAWAAETGDFFYLLPDCGLSTSVTVCIPSTVVSSHAFKTSPACRSNYM